MTPVAELGLAHRATSAAGGTHAAGAPFVLTPTTDPGRRLCALAARLAARLAEDAAAHDRDAAFPFAGAAALRESGFYAAPVPAPLGGMGVESVHDLVVASSRLAQGDPSLTIGVNMHMATVANIARHRRRMLAAGEAAHAATISEALAAIARDRTIIATAISEPGQDITHPSATAVRESHGWRIQGRKIFTTGSPAATVLSVSVTYTTARGEERYGFAQVPAGAPGVVMHGDWDALGMRASGSQSVSFENVELPAAALRGGFPAGDARGYMEVYGSAGLFHAAAALGIAEASARGAVAAARRLGVPGARGRMLLAENAVDLSAARATLSRTAALLDAHDGPDADPVALFGEAQAAKAFVGQATEGIVARALELSGGAGYLNGHPLARAYRDVKAVSFMHPLGANRAYDAIADLALGRAPELH
jgi:alkylation response protein AidB-like acyl-CoA dehydrogenase